MLPVPNTRREPDPSCGFPAGYSAFAQAFVLLATRVCSLLWL